MRAVVYREYGTPAVLKLEEVPQPEPGPGELLLRVRASSVNSWDHDLIRGTPWLTRLVDGGLQRPKRLILGADVAGVVEATGPGVTRFVPGDEVFGDLSGGKWGGFAEFTVAREDEVVRKPAEIGFEEAAAVPQAGLLALQALRLGGGVRAGQHVLVNGGGGGVGSFAIQLARLFGARVTGVDRGEKHALMRELGAERVIDYRHEDYTDGGARYDRIIDVMANRPLAAYRRALAPEGRLVVVGGRTGAIAAVALAGLMGRKEGGQRLGLLLHRPNGPEIEEMGALVAAGTIRPVIERVYPLEETAAAVARVGDGMALGKLVVAV